MMIVRTVSLFLLLLVPACDSSDAPREGARRHEHEEETTRGGHDEHGDHTSHNEGDADEDEGHDDHEKGIVEIHPDAAARVKIRTAPAEIRSLDAVLSTTGRVDFNQDRLAHVSPRIPGRVHEVRALLGQSVTAGDVLLVIDSVDLGQAKSEFLQAKAQLDLTRRTLDREKGLLSDKITSEQAVLEARTAHQQALAAFQAARERLRLLGLSNVEIEGVRYNDPAAALFSLRSPIDGTVVEKRASLGEMLTPERSPYTVADLRILWIWVDVYERDLARVHIDDDVEVTLAAHEERVFRGRVTYIRSDVDPDTRTARARITVEDPDGHLKPGMFASVTVTDPHRTTGETPTTTVVVPASAVQRDGADSIAFVSIGEHRYERRVLTLGRRTETFVEVVAGVSPGELVVVEGTFILKSEAAKESMGGAHGH